ncbi:MAG: diguanylate cyclase [Oscillibacter sp.]|nr:diguanylate cyclase [Oscillibacter sp.]
MFERRVQAQIAAIMVIIFMAFFGNALFFSSLNTDIFQMTAEMEADLYSRIIANAISMQTPEEGITRNMPSLAGLVRENVGFRVTSASGGMFYSSPGAPFGWERPSQAALEEAAQNGRAVFWSGNNNPFLLRQDCYVVRPLFDGAYFLETVLRGGELQAMQRRQFALLMGIDALLMALMVILIGNIISKYRREILRYATTDELTGLANRKAFNAIFADFSKAERRSEASLFLLDIDFFKQINDNYGHAAGDNALRHLARNIQDMTNRRGGFAGRWGGDEFIGILPIGGAEAHEALLELCRKIEASRPPDGFRMTISAGVAPVEDGATLAKLSEKADLALYQSKEGGRNTASLYEPTRGDAQKAAEVRQPATVAAAIARAEKLVIPAKTDAPAAPGLSKRFRERLKTYFRERFVRGAILGVRWMAPFIAGGGILIGLAFLFDAAAVDLSDLSLDIRAQFGSITPAAAALNNIGSVTFNFMLPVFAGFMAYGIAGEEAFMAGFVGGYMTIDSRSGFIGAMAAGMAAGIITGELRQFTNRLPRFFRKIAPIVVYPVFNLLFMQGVSWLIITPLSSALGRAFTSLLNAASAKSRIAAGALSGGMMAFDMGGIVNKVAYNYGVGGIAQGRADMMASVMAGGMAPPIGIFLSMLLFRKKFSEAEWERGPGALFMGLSFITEGALPYVFTDIWRVIPSCMAGSAVAGGLSALGGCALPAPHGGIFVLPLIANPAFYALSVAAGSLVTGVVLGLWKPVCRAGSG